jgi:hypothetical protein
MPGGSVYEDHTFNKETALTSHKTSQYIARIFTVQVREHIKLTLAERIYSAGKMLYRTTLNKQMSLKINERHRQYTGTVRISDICSQSNYRCRILSHNNFFF